MKRLFALTLFSLLAISCSHGNSSGTHSSKGGTLTYNVDTQAELDAANQRVNDYRQELLRQGFHQVWSSHSVTAGIDSPTKEEFVLEGQYGKLKDLKVTFWIKKRLEKDQPHLGGSIEASLHDEQAERDFDELYKKVSFVVTGNAQ
jgi:hypothetical protein